MSWRKTLKKNKILTHLELSPHRQNASYATLTVLLEGLAHHTTMKVFAMTGQNDKTRYAPSTIKKITDVLAKMMDPSCHEVPTSHMRTFKLHYFDHFQDQDWTVVAESLRRNTSLEHLELVNVGLRGTAMRTLAQSLTINKTLQTLKVPYIWAPADGALSFFLDKLPLICGLCVFLCYDSIDSDQMDELLSKFENSYVRVTCPLPNNVKRENCFYYDLNWRGRYLLSPNMNQQEIPLGLWPLIFSKMTNNNEEHLLYYFLQHKIELLASVRSSQTCSTVVRQNTCKSGTRLLDNNSGTVHKKQKTL